MLKGEVGKNNTLSSMNWWGFLGCNPNSISLCQFLTGVSLILWWWQHLSEDRYFLFYQQTCFCVHKCERLPSCRRLLCHSQARNQGVQTCQFATPGWFHIASWRNETGLLLLPFCFLGDIYIGVSTWLGLHRSWPGKSFPDVLQIELWMRLRIYRSKWNLQCSRQVVHPLL